MYKIVLSQDYKGIQVPLCLGKSLHGNPRKTILEGERVFIYFYEKCL
jgi:hypothetical protein